MDLTGIDLRCADLSVAIFKGCDLSNVNMSGGFFTMADFSGANMGGVRMNVPISRASFRKANVKKGNFANANLGYLNVETERAAGVSLGSRRPCMRQYDRGDLQRC